MAVGRPEIDPTWIEPSQETTITGSGTPGQSSSMSKPQDPAPIPPPVPSPVGPPSSPPPAMPRPPVASVPVPQAPPPPPPPPAAPHVPRDERSQPLPTSKPRLGSPFRWLIAGVLVLVIGAGLFLASEAGLINLDIEQLWGLSNRPTKAFQAAANGLAAAGRYHVDAELKFTFTQPVRMPRLASGGLVQASAGALLAAADDGEAFLGTRLNQDVADGSSLVQSEWQFVAPKVVRGQMGAPFTHELPVRIDALAADDALYLRLPKESAQWTKVAATELKVVGVTPLDWARLYRSLGESVGEGKRLPGRTIQGETAKGYQATVPGSALAGLVAPGTLPAGEVTVESWIGTKTHRPYLLTVRGTIGATEPVATIVFGQFAGTQSVSPPVASEVAPGTLAEWVVGHTLIAADTPASRDALRKADLARIKETLATYATEARPFAYPKTDGIVQLGQANDVTESLLQYSSPMPADPLAPNRYYGYTSDGTTYRLTAVFEQAADPAGTKEGDLTLYVVTP